MISGNPLIDDPGMDIDINSKKESIEESNDANMEEHIANGIEGNNREISDMIEVEEPVVVASPEVIDITHIDDDVEIIEDEDEDDDEEEEMLVEREGVAGGDDDDVIVIGDDSDTENIIASQVGNTAKNPGLILANDFASVGAKAMKPVQDYPVKDEAHYVWEIKDWNSLREEKVRSPRFKCGGFEWNILLFPHGNQNSNAISIYMEPHPLGEEESDGKPVDENWYVCAQFALDLWNPHHPEAHLSNGSHHRFNKNETDWGFSSLIDLKQLTHGVNNLRNPTPHPILANNQINITGYVRVIDDSSTGVLWHNFLDYDSKLGSGYVGLNNQGATCYLNSLLQSYFTTKFFRKLVYEIPTHSTGELSNVALSLQRIFYLLSTSNEPVATLELTKSFGWDSSDAFTQHDVQELNRILMDKLETAMKGTKIEGKLNDIFVGKMKSYIKCVNVPYESSRVEDFWDIQLNVKGFRNLQDSFKNYIEIEMLDGENKYQAGDQYGYQDAKKGVVFEAFPPVLHLQLKRFEYDFQVDDLVKIDDFYEFPDKIDLKPYLDEDLSEEIKNENWNYKLHGVLVHQGSISNGHYYAMIKPYGDNETWLRFDDDKVWKVTPTQVFQDNFGARDLTQEELNKMTRIEQQDHLLRRVTSAYMLVYYREEALPDILPKNDEIIDESIPKHIPGQIKFEIEERERIEKQKQEALYYINVKLITLTNINNNLGFDLALDSTVLKFYDESLKGSLCDPKSYKVKKEDNFKVVNELVEKELGYTEQAGFRLISVCHRNNHTNRADVPVRNELLETHVNNVYFKSFNRKFDEMVFYVEELNKDIRSINKLTTIKQVVTPEKFTFESVWNKINDVGTKLDDDLKFKNIEEYSKSIILFIKYFDPISQEIRTLSHINVSKDDLIESIIEPIRELLGFDQDVSLEFYEEISPVKVEKIDVSVSFDKQELNNGDIITVQVSNVNELTQDKVYHNLKDYYRFMLTRIRIQVEPFKAEIDEEDFDFVEGGENKEKEESVDIQIAKNLSKTFQLWASVDYSYQQLAQEIAQRLNVDPNYLRIFVLGNKGQRYPLKTTNHLSQLFPKHIPVNQLIHFEYEILNIPLKDYENLKAVKIHWLTSLLQYQVFEILISKTGTVYDLIEKLLHKVNVPKDHLKYLLCWAGNNHMFTELIKFDMSLNQIQDGTDLYCGVFPIEVEILTVHNLISRYVDDKEEQGDDDEEKKEDEDIFDNEVVKEEFIMAKKEVKNLNLIPTFHFHKNISYRHGIPFVLVVYPNETFKDTKERLRKKLGLGIQAFEKVRIALVDNDETSNGSYIDNDDLILFDEIGKVTTSVSVALDHPDRIKRSNQFDKGISIK
ncbi:Ubiquitin carboxyl-terminal hydrolase 15 [Spathaspora sp. JA1]|nr:Ubiquitin carboxyl-terminal hydrolase 15 [Spathaspora sp. JA1]